MLSRRNVVGRVLAGLAVLGLSRGPASATLPPDMVDRVESYLNGIDTLRARFSQVAPDGAFSQGRVFMDRPGRLRFEYDPPNEMLIVATDWRLVMYDPKADQRTTLPLDRTPLGLLLDDEIVIGREVALRGLAEINDELHMTLFKTDEPELGEIELVFGMSPIELRRWQVLDPQGKLTQVLLEDVEVNVRLDRSLFSAIGLD